MKTNAAFILKYFGSIKVVCIVLSGILLPFNVNTSLAQDPILSQFYASPIYLNPAFAGTYNGYRTTINFRTYPLPDVNNISTVNASFDAKVPALYGGIGLVATSDYLGEMLWGTHLGLTYAYHLQLNRDWFLNFAAQAGYYRRDIRWSKLNFAEPGQLPPDHGWKQTVDFATGLLVYNDWFYGGLAVHHLTQPNISLFDSEHKIMLKHTLHAGIYIEPGASGRANRQLFDSFVSPNIIIQAQEPFFRINYGLYAGIEKFMAGVWFRQDLSDSNTMVFLIGLKLDQINIGYSYDHSFSGFTDALHSIHEISLTWLLQGNHIVGKRPRCPCF